MAQWAGDPRLSMFLAMCICTFRYRMVVCETHSPDRTELAAGSLTRTGRRIA